MIRRPLLAYAGPAEQGEPMLATVIEQTPPPDAGTLLRELAVALLGYALALADRPPLDPEQAADLFASALYRQPPPRIADRAELAAEAESEARLLAAVHGKTRLAEREGVWMQSVSLAADRASLERFGAPLRDYADWMAALDRRRQCGLARETWLEGDTLHRRLWLPTVMTMAGATS